MKSIYYLILVHVEIKVPESSTLHQCINTKISKYNDIFRLSTLVIEIYEVMKNYNINLLKHRLLTNIVNEVIRRNTKV
ncbi:unnamed protein product [Schistosoma curassoni]|nr:unnamed protein product [Schistosoma curassoni]